ncbi:MAG: hypothetical protein ABR540_11955 [Acidimicrobiales bacterium]|nr:hypothetical protein [Actinomycetota bacterium]
MSFQASDLGSILENGRERAGLGVSDLWMRYVGNGGMATLSQMECYLAGATRPSRLEYDVLVSALNDQFIDMRLNSPIPYFHELG